MSERKGPSSSVQASFDKSTADILHDDVLVKVFFYIKLDELLSLELVCSKWHRVINSLMNPFWKKICEQKLKSCPRWQQICKYEALPFPATPSDYKGMYEYIHRKIQELDDNWRHGSFSERYFGTDNSGFVHNFRRYDSFHIDFDDEILVYPVGLGIEVHNYRTKKILYLDFSLPNEMDSPSIKIHEDLFFVMDAKHVMHTIIIFESGSGKKIAEIQEPGEILTAIYRSGVLVVEATNNSGVQLWRRKGDNFELVRNQEFDDLVMNVQMDERYIAVFVDVNFGYEIYFISTTSLTIDRSIGVKFFHAFGHYDQGIFFHVSFYGVIHLLEVSTGKRLHTITYQSRLSLGLAVWPIPVRDRSKIRVNSKYVVIMEPANDCSILHIFDLTAAKSPSADPNTLNLHILKVNLLFWKFKMNERQIYGLGKTSESVREGVFKSLDFGVTADSECSPRMNACKKII